MRSFKLNKLIRDKVLTDMEGLGQTVISRHLSDQEFLHELTRKLQEESKEFNPQDPKALDELCDVLEVIESLAKQLGTDFEGLRNRQSIRKEKRGGFETRTFVDHVNLQDDDQWVEYYAKEPERFPEVSSDQRTN